ncbi:hypothetical protein [Cupriavidus pauculus]|uniref:Uncharacterized protein n=1 Tax=Cupriavidus pauculus TaxID=82633 RepID=A0A2N5C8Z5_9BURK|nr:hypothetical protein [Cupriavidus pauculus]PLP98705.1 hypothetical protein CYJ10_20610 [Cupriavidus pauculus]
MTTPLQHIGNRLARLRRDALVHFRRHGMRDYPSYQTRLLGNRLRVISDDAERLGLALADLLMLLGTNVADWQDAAEHMDGRCATLFALSFVGMEWSATRRRDEWNTSTSAPLLYCAGSLILESVNTDEGEIAYRPIFASVGMSGMDDEQEQR